MPAARSTVGRRRRGLAWLGRRGRAGFTAACVLWSGVHLGMATPSTCTTTVTYHHHHRLERHGPRVPLPAARSCTACTRAEMAVGTSHGPRSSTLCPACRGEGLGGAACGEHSRRRRLHGHAAWQYVEIDAHTWN